MPKNPPLSFVFGLSFAEQSEFFRQKLNLPTAKWDDISRSAHDRAFVVAGAAKADLLSDLHAAVQKAIDGGTTLETFRKDFREIVGKHGWHGWTGEGTKAGEAWRTRIIYETNLRTSYAAGRYAQLTDPELLSRCPYWKYIHDDGVASPRLEHVAWDGLTLRHDHPFWETHYPPNGWGCCCRVMAVPAPEEGAKTEPPKGWDGSDPKTGAPAGIDKGWDYAPGKSAAEELRNIVAEKAANLTAELGAALFESVAPKMGEPLREAASQFVQETVHTRQAKGESVLMHVMSTSVVAQMSKLKHPLETAGVWLTDEALLHGIRDTKAARGASLPVSTWENLPALMDKAEVYLDTKETALLYVFQAEATPGGKLEKVVITVNYTEKTRLAGTKGKRQKVLSNYIRTGGLVDVLNIENNPLYVPLSK